jgi:hypothetical protein
MEITYHNKIKWQVVFFNWIRPIADIQELNPIQPENGVTANDVEVRIKGL